MGDDDDDDDFFTEDYAATTVSYFETDAAATVTDNLDNIIDDADDDDHFTLAGIFSTYRFLIFVKMEGFLIVFAGRVETKEQVIALKLKLMSNGVF